MIENQNIISVLKRYKYKWPPLKVEEGITFSHLVVVSLGRQRLHDSGYPYIQVLGADDNHNLYDLGEHDHIWFRGNWDVNIDSLGVNIFRVWSNKPYTPHRVPITSTIEIDENYEIR